MKDQMIEAWTPHTATKRVAQATQREGNSGEETWSLPVRRQSRAALFQIHFTNGHGTGGCSFVQSPGKTPDKFPISEGCVLSPSWAIPWEIILYNNQCMSSPGPQSTFAHSAFSSVGKSCYAGVWSRPEKLEHLRAAADYIYSAFLFQVPQTARPPPAHCIRGTAGALVQIDLRKPWLPRPPSAPSPNPSYVPFARFPASGSRTGDRVLIAADFLCFLISGVDYSGAISSAQKVERQRQLGSLTTTTLPATPTPNLHSGPPPRRMRAQQRQFRWGVGDGSESRVSLGFRVPPLAKIPRSLALSREGFQNSGGNRAWEARWLVVRVCHRGAMAAEKKRLSVKEAFRLAQQPHQNQAKLVVALSRTYGAVSGLTSAPPPPCPPHPAAPAQPFAFARPV